MKTVGIIGGFGPETSATFMKRLLSLWSKKKTGFRPEILLWNAPVDESHEKMFISSGKKSDEFKEILISGARKMEKAGADFLVLPCNSLHIFIGHLRQSVEIPIHSLLNLTAKELIKRKVKNIGFLSTSATRKSKMFDEVLTHTNLIKLDVNDQINLDKIISNLVTNSHERSSQNFRGILSKFKRQKIKQVLLACTDLQLLRANVKGIELIDTLEILARATIKKMSGNN